MPPGLPTVFIDDTNFYVDIHGLQFVQVDDPRNCISFSDVEDTDTECIILYDRSTKNAFQGSFENFQASTTTTEVRLPCLASLDPPTVAALLQNLQSPPADLVRAVQALKQIEKPVPTIRRSKKRH